MHGLIIVYTATNDNQPQIPTNGGGRPRVTSCYIRQMSEADLLIPAEQVKLLDRVGQGGCRVHCDSFEL